MLEPAMRRKKDWTPPRESAPTYSSPDSSATKELRSARDEVFETLQKSYAFVGDPAAHVKVPLPDTEVLGKRKVIEMVSTGNRQKPPEASPTKSRAPKKRPRTITDLATAAYRPPEKETVPSAEAHTGSLLAYLEPPEEQAAVARKDAGVKPKASRGRKARTVKRKEQPPKPILLSPTSAMQQVARQDFVFGTASQLATEDDPELLRALHEAMQASNRADSGSDLTPSPKRVSSRLAGRRRPGTGLWAAGARCDDGDLGVDVLDLTRSSSPWLLGKNAPERSDTNHESAISGASHEKTGLEIELSDETFPHSISSPPTIGRHHSLPSSPGRDSRQVVQPDQETWSNNDLETASEEFELGPPPSNQEQSAGILSSRDNSSGQEERGKPPAPNFEMYSDVRLAKEVASYGFKAVKKRTAMIAILKQCWESQNKATFGSRSAFAAMSTSSTGRSGSPPKPSVRAGTITKESRSTVAEPAPKARRGKKSVTAGTAAETEAAQPIKRPRGRPRKNSTASSLPNATEPRAIYPAYCGEKLPTLASDTERDGTCVPGRTTPVPSTPRGKSSSRQIVEIPDSDSDDTFGSTAASSPESCVDVFSPSLALDFSVTEDTESSLTASPTSQQAPLFQYITKAIVDAPRTTNPDEPSWYEKMLMYDPIILEDLTAWLNSGQLDKVGYDGEVSPGDVKKWCESKSVCCLWRENTRGETRKRF
ncbi:hypothetical protein VTH06DRAFT_2367 [Thermothelomyces fergusii]